MKKLKRRDVMISAGALETAPYILKSSPAQAPEFSYKYSSDLKSDHPTVQRVKEAADAIRKDSGSKRSDAGRHSRQGRPTTSRAGDAQSVRRPDGAQCRLHQGASVSAAGRGLG
jgi:hypothetical protein